ncbi:MAG: N-methyl-L-tryptophan oxidase [Anaerolineae bacterium]|nr:N-methyl-L-tryptophan oxidase [Anaerolineae bacterium]
MKTSYEVIILGLGGIGSGAAYWLGRRYGRDVLGLEQFEIGHGRGGSQDHSRIIRLSYHTPAYVALAKQAYQAWAALEADAGESLILKTGGLDFFPANAAIPSADYTESMAACGVPFAWLSAAEVRYRWPQFHLTDDVQAIFQAESGITPAAKCNAAHLRLAQAYGVVLQDDEKVTAVHDSDAEIIIITDKARYQCRYLIITGGAWSNEALAHFGWHLPLTVTQEQVMYFATPDPAAFARERFPVWIWMDDPCYYGFPVYGEAGIKVAQDVGGAEVTAVSRTFTPNPANAQRVTDFTKRLLPGGYGPPILTKTCLYTLTPDRDFVIDTLPGHPQVAVAIGAGHAFKFASLIGKLLGELVTTGADAIPTDLSPFQMSRPILSEKNPAKHFLV